jgi:hypothetical protein
LTVSKTGQARFVGKLGDGVPVSISGVIDGDGDWPFLFSKAGSGRAGAELLLGDVAFPPPADGSAGSLTWYRTADGIYSGGFSTRVPIVVSRYASPAVQYGTANVTISGGDLGAAFVEPISIDSKDRVTPTGSQPFKLMFTPKTGLFSGSFPDNGMVRPFAGVVLQSGSFCAGLFQDGSGHTGSVDVEPAQ